MYLFYYQQSSFEFPVAIGLWPSRVLCYTVRWNEHKRRPRGKRGLWIYSTVISFLSFVSAGAHKVHLLNVNLWTFYLKVAEYEGGGISQLIPVPTTRLLRVRYPLLSPYKVSPILRFLLLKRPARIIILLQYWENAKKGASYDHLR